MRRVCQIESYELNAHRFSSTNEQPQRLILINKRGGRISISYKNSSGLPLYSTLIKVSLYDMCLLIWEFEDWISSQSSKLQLLFKRSCNRNMN